MKLSFEQYLVRRQVGDTEAANVLKTCPPPVLTAACWADAMHHLSDSGADESYVRQLRRFWQGYARLKARG